MEQEDVVTRLHVKVANIDAEISDLYARYGERVYRLQSLGGDAAPIRRQIEEKQEERAQILQTIGHVRSL